MSCTTCQGECPLSVREIALMCWTCSHRRDTVDAKGVKVTSCTIDGIELQDRKTCQRGYFGKDGITRLFGVRFYRVPKPIRWLFWLTHWNYPPSYFRACGCLKRLRDWWDRVKIRTTSIPTPNREHAPL